MADAGAKPAFKGYYTPAAGSKYPVRVVHVGERRDRPRDAVAEAEAEEGRHRFDRYRREVERYYGDSAITVPIGEVSEPAKKLLKVTRESLELAIEKVRAGNRLFDICGTVEQHVTANGFSVVREYVGHGIGTKLHEEPQVPNYVDRRNENPRLKRRHGAGDRADGERRASRTCEVLNGQVDGGDEGWVVFGPLRALRGGDGERAVGFDAAVKMTGGSDRGGVAAERAGTGEAGERSRGSGSCGWARRKRILSGCVRAIGCEVELSPHDPTRGRIVRRLTAWTRNHESSSVGQENVRQVQGHPPRRRGAGDLHQPETQAAARLRGTIWHVLQAWICPAKKRAEIGLTYIYGIGRTRALSLLTGPASTPTRRSPT